MFLGLLGFGWVGVGIVVSVATAITTSAINYKVTKDRAEEAEKKAKEQALKQERKAKVMHLKQFNRALGAYNTGALLAKRDLVQAKRERAYNYGKTVS